MLAIAEWSDLIGHYQTTGLQYLNFNWAKLKSYVYKQVLLWCWTNCNAFVQHIYWFVKIPNKKGTGLTILKPIQIGNWQILAKILHSDWSIGCTIFSGPEQILLHPNTNFKSKNLTELTWKFEFHMLQWIFAKFESKAKWVVTTQ